MNAPWQPIASAPRDGRHFITANFLNSFDERGEYEIARFDPREYDAYEAAENGLFRKVTKISYEFTSDNWHRATHWAEIPKEPT